MAGYPGFDTDGFPGADQLAWMKANTNLVWVGYYLAPAPSHANTSWMGQRAALQAAGWGLAPVYVGQEIAGPGRHLVTGAQGAIDGADAANLMTQDGFAAGSHVFLDLEDGPPYAAPRTDYVAAWAEAVSSAGFQPSIYCSHLIAADVQAALPNARIWAFRVATTSPHAVPGTTFPDPDPSGCGYAGAFAWQRDQACNLQLSGAPHAALSVDLSTALGPDPSAP